MTMVPARNFLQHHQHYTSYGVGFFQGTGGGGGSSKFELRSDLGFGYMAEDESQTTSLNEAGSSKLVQEEDTQEREVGEEEEDDDDEEEEEEEGGVVGDGRWLQLGLGSQDVTPPDASSQRGKLIELDLFRAPQPIAQTLTTSPIPSMPLYMQPPLTSLCLRQRQQPEIAWTGFRHGPWSPVPSSSSLPFYPRPFQQPYRGISGSFPAVDVAGPSSSDIRVLDAPARPQSGLWFLLQASQNQEREPILPQIFKSYLRIKDGRMTVRLLMKYLANKLGLNSESEIEITCRGQQLSPSTTLQHVRDNIWGSREAVTLVPDTPATNHVMLLRYSRSA